MKHLLILFLFLLNFNCISQNKGAWYFLWESGFNDVNGKTNIHFGAGTEYFLSNTSSLTFRLKYFKTGIDYFEKGSSCGFAGFFCSTSKRFLYEGSALVIPINYKWEKAMFSSRLKFLFTTGLAINFSLTENYIEIKGITPDYNTTNINFNLGIGFIYKINPKFDLFTIVEMYSGNPKSEEKIGFIFSSKLRTEESLINFGVRYKLN